MKKTILAFVFALLLPLTAQAQTTFVIEAECNDYDKVQFFAKDTDLIGRVLFAEMGCGLSPYFDLKNNVSLGGTLLTDLFAAKAAAVHTHAISDVSGLQTALDSKATAFTPEPAIADADDNLTLLSILNVHTEINEDRAKINEILAVLRAQGMIAE